MEDEEILDESLDEIESLSEQLALHTMEIEAQQEQILEGEVRIEECLARLEQFSTQNQSPVSQAMVTEITSLKSEVTELKGMIVTMAASLATLNQSIPRVLPIQSEPENPPQPENPVEHVPERSTDEPAPEETRRKHRIL